MNGKLSKNLLFRESHCSLSVKQAASLCFKDVSEVLAWDRGKEIPPECKRLMRFYSRRELSFSEEWHYFSIECGKLKTPTGQYASPQQILTGLALLEIGSEVELMTSRKLLKTAQALERIRRLSSFDH